MKWQDVRDKFPHRWLVLEAIKSHREGDYWIADDLSVLDQFEDGWAAIQRYGELHREWPQREVFFYHADREAIRIQQIPSLGLRV